MKKKILISILLTLMLSACGGTQKNKQQEAKDPQVQIVAAIFPAYDWTRNILGENPGNADLALLLDNGVDLHSYQPSVDDILTISNADLFIYVGGESDQWVTDALKNANNPKLHILKMIDVIGDAAQLEETVEGMQAEENEEDENVDEHIWLSFRNAAAITDAITAELSTIAPDHASVYQYNAEEYKLKLSALDNAYAQVIKDSRFKTLLFADRFPFRYLTEDYGLTYYAAFSGCSAETEASFETITFLAQKCDELGLPAVLTIDGTDHRIADTVIHNTENKDQALLTLDSMQSVSSKDIEAGTTYLSIMESNLEILRQALEAN